MQAARRHAIGITTCRPSADCLSVTRQRQKPAEHADYGECELAHGAEEPAARKPRRDLLGHLTESFEH
jgi:hypothetical protein